MTHFCVHLMPGVAQVVSISVGHCDQGLDGVNVLLLHLSDAGTGRQQSEPGQGLNVRISLQLWTKQVITAVVLNIFNCTLATYLRTIVNHPHDNIIHSSCFKM